MCLLYILDLHTNCCIGFRIYAILYSLECPSGCDTCTVDYSSNNDATSCTANGCTPWDGKKAYTTGETGTCERKYLSYSQILLLPLNICISEKNHSQKILILHNKAM